jgi:hypothetical protein
MKFILVLITLISLVGCTTLRPLVGAPTELREHLANDRVVGTGDYVRVTAADGKSHEFAVVAVAAGQLVGTHESIAIDDVVALKRRKFSTGRTVALAIVIGLVVVVGALYLAWQHTAGFSLGSRTGG